MKDQADRQGLIASTDYRVSAELALAIHVVPDQPAGLGAKLGAVRNQDSSDFGAFSQLMQTFATTKSVP